MKQELPDLETSKKFFQAWTKNLGSRDIILLNGPLGVGKTQTVRTMVESLGGKWVSSPSFAIHQRYKTPKKSVDHVDLYRLKDEHDLESTGFWDLFGQEEGLIFIEWAARLQDEVWPPNWTIWKFELSFKGEGREVSISNKFTTLKI